VSSLQPHRRLILIVEAVLITGGIYWSVVESSVGLISACLPTVYGIFRSKTRGKSMQSSKVLRSSPSTGGTWSSQTSRGIRLAKNDRLRSDSQASDIELASGTVQATAEASSVTGTWDTGLQDQILVTKTFAASGQSMQGKGAKTCSAA